MVNHKEVRTTVAVDVHVRHTKQVVVPSIGVAGTEERAVTVGAYIHFAVLVEVFEESRRHVLYIGIGFERYGEIGQIAL